MSTPADAGDPVSWFLIEPGWRVVAADGSEAGTVVETVGDSTHDIFDGLSVKCGGLAGKRYVAAEDVEEITEGRVKLGLTAEQASRLPPYVEPAPQERIVPEGGSWWTRLRDAFRRPRA